MDRLSVDLGHELRKRVELRLPGSPVVTSSPVVGKTLEVVAGHTPAPSYARQLTRPSCASQPLLKIVQLSLGNGDVKRLNRCGFDQGPTPLASTVPRHDDCKSGEGMSYCPGQTERVTSARCGRRRARPSP